MTGNNKVWRAPLAGLASVAMIATMGVAAATANANTPGQTYNFDVTLDANGGKFTGDATTKKVNSADNSDDIAKDGHFNDLYEAANKPTNGTQQFLGWYTAAQGGEKFDFQSAFVNKATTLYAHWADPSDVVVLQFKLGEVDAPASAAAEANSGVALTASGYYAVYSSKQEKKIPSWELPTDTIDKKALTGFETSKLGTAGTTEVKADTLTSDFSGLLQNGVASKQNLVLSPVTTEDAATVNYKDGSTVLFNYDIAYGAEVPQTEYWFGSANRKVTKWNKSGKAEDGAYTVLAAPSTDASDTHVVDLYAIEKVDAFRARFYTEINNLYALYAQKTVNKGDTVSVDAPSRDGYDFVGWAVKGTNEVVDLSTLKFNQSYDFDAIWKKSAAEVTFHWNYQEKTTVQKYAGNETFQAPTAAEGPARDGFVFDGWYTDAKLTTPVAFEGAQIRWNDAYNRLEYLAVAGSSSDNAGEETSKGVWTELPTDFYAKWIEADADLVNDEEAVVRGLFYVNGEDGDLKKAADQKSFTEASFTKASADWQSYVAKKYKLGPNDQDLTKAEAAELVSDLKAIQEELVFNNSKTVWRLQNKESGRHQVTSGENEFNYLRTHGWKSEGIAFKTADENLLKKEAGSTYGDAAVAGLLTPVERLYNTDQDRQHLVPAGANEMNLTKSGWNDEGPAFYKANNGNVPVYRLYWKSQNEHFWVTGAKEYNAYQNNPDFSLEGTGFTI